MSIGLLVTNVSSAEAAEWIDPVPEAILTCTAVDTIKLTQQGAEPAQYGCRLGFTRRECTVHMGATWRIRLNCSCAAAMRLYVKLV